MIASVLAVGTELTIGQIVNKNAATISEKMKPLGIEVGFHFTVPDHRSRILNALLFAEQYSEIIVVTGGLGPTSDDFTRELISEWSGFKLQFHEPSWLHVQERLTSRGFSAKEMQRQQCYFPETSAVLKNSHGTANGFYLQVQRTKALLHVFVLPGPPREIESIWKDHVQSLLQQLTKGFPRVKTLSWDTLGLGESDVATLVENELKSNPTLAKKIEIGYRVHLPYVEVKATFLESEHLEVQSLIDAIDEALKSITVARNFVDLAEVAATFIKDREFTFYDFVSGGFLSQRLHPYIKNNPRWNWQQSTVAKTADFFDGDSDFFALLPLDDGKKCLFLYNLDGFTRQQVIESIYTSPLMAERRQQYFAEMALVYFSKHLA